MSGLAQKNVVGRAISAGDVITIEIQRTVGKVNPKINSPFSFDYPPIEEDSEIDWALVELKMNELLVPGQNPMSLSTLREYCRYPSVYDDSAVFLGEFEFLIRRKYPELDFIAVWNEAIEEVARGAGSLDNINTLFVACYDGSETILAQPDIETPVLPTVITSLTDKQTAIKQTLLAADNSYKVTFYTPVTSEITITVTAKISTAHVVEAVAAKIKQELLKAFNRDAGNHASKPVQRLAYSLLIEKVPELSVGNAYLKVDVVELTGAFRPELWRYVTASSIAVTVTQTNIALPGWGG
ncbi:hypothetical protein [Methylocucumis oryzae]|uniref:Baseplate protein J-like domain-containing protein n=1 Tax=Methylocucumis oryzae TaxID=1632867 RepID=A0A0F3IN70_9GAMM|nr:hypothetical protein [Methylocucumis oryzae]KJV08092.1 hypothetical protein VZ94_00605 [Methylocucumis oryzae]